MIPVERCPVCEGTKFDPFAMDPWSPSKLHFNQARCTGCGLLVGQPQAEEKEMEAYYGGVYYDEQWPDPDAIWAQNRISYQTYELPVMRALWAERPPPSGGAVAEIGCGYGVMLGLLRDEGFAVRGCELSEKAVSYCRSRGLDVVKGRSPGVPLPKSSFDLVVTMHVIEHVARPAIFVEELLSLLRPGGILAIGTEDAWISQYAWDRARARATGRIPPFRSSNDHTFVFDSKQLTKLMVKAGCVDVQTRSFSHTPKGESLHWRAYKGMFRLIDRLTNHGEFLIAVARKPEDRA